MCNEYGPLRHDLTPFDLELAGYFIRTHICDGWCWWKRNPFGTGSIFGKACDTIDEAVADARHMMTGQSGQLTLCVADDIAPPANLWPEMPDLPDGVDMFAEYPVAGEGVNHG